WERPFRFATTERTMRWVLQQKGGKVRGGVQGADGRSIGSIEGLVNGEVFSWRLTGPFIPLNTMGYTSSRSYDGETPVVNDEMNGRVDGPGCPAEELGVALAYWAAYYRALPGTPRLAGALDLGDALLRIPLFLSGQARPGMPREVYLHVMQAHGGEFAEAVDSAAQPESVEPALSPLTEAGARLYLANASRQPLVLLHTVTAPAALRLLLPHLPAGLPKTGLAYVWQNVAATAAAYGDERPPVHDEWPPQEPSAIIERSLASDDPHALKFAEACIREHRLNPHPVYLAAAADWASRLHRARHWSPAERDAAGLEFR